MRTLSIVGGGIAGLSLAAALDPARWSVTLHEAYPDREPAGTALGMWPDVLPELDRLGAGSALRLAGVPIPRLEVRDARGRILAGVAGDGLLVDRPSLLRVLDDLVPPSVVRSGHRVERPADLDDDVVVGADGVHSAVRRGTWPGSASRATRHMALRGVADVARSSAVETWNAGVLCGLSTMAGGRTNWYLATRGTAELTEVETMSDATALALALRLAAPFGEETVHAVRATPPSSLLRQQIHVAPARWQLTRGRVALVGDAAHAMCPNLGRGACESILDAVTLGRLLNESGSVAAAFAAYQRARAPRTQAMRLAARAMMGVATIQHGAWVRDALLRATAGRSLSRAIDASSASP